ncbi:hypothetical protein BCR33DRAFT_720385, partial [Rhizoclosmatium globosum]
TRPLDSINSNVTLDTQNEAQYPNELTDTWSLDLLTDIVSGDNVGSTKPVNSAPQTETEYLKEQVQTLRQQLDSARSETKTAFESIQALERLLVASQTRCKELDAENSDTKKGNIRRVSTALSVGVWEFSKFSEYAYNL